MLNRTFRFCAIGLLVSSAGLATAIAAPDAAIDPGLARCAHRVERATPADVAALLALVG